MPFGYINRGLEKLIVLVSTFAPAQMFSLLASGSLVSGCNCKCNLITWETRKQIVLSLNIWIWPWMALFVTLRQVLMFLNPGMSNSSTTSTICSMRHWCQFFFTILSALRCNINDPAALLQIRSEGKIRSADLWSPSQHVISESKQGRQEKVPISQYQWRL